MLSGRNSRFELVVHAYVGVSESLNARNYANAALCLNNLYIYKISNYRELKQVSQRNGTVPNNRKVGTLY